MKSIQLSRYADTYKIYLFWIQLTWFMSFSYSQCSQTITSYDNKEKHKFSALKLLWQKSRVLQFAWLSHIQRLRMQWISQALFDKNECTQVFGVLPPYILSHSVNIAQLMTNSLWLVVFVLLEKTCIWNICWYYDY